MARGDTESRAPDAQKFAWSRDSSKLALSDFGKDDVRRLTVSVGVDGRSFKQLRLDVVPASFPRAPLAWSPSGRQLIFAGHVGDDPDQIWVVASNGGGLHRVNPATQGSKAPSSA